MQLLHVLRSQSGTLRLISHRDLTSAFGVKRKWVAQTGRAASGENDPKATLRRARLAELFGRASVPPREPLQRLANRSD